MPEVSRVCMTPPAADLVRKLYAANGPLMFHQSGGCCDGSSPMCYTEGEFRTGASDVLLAALRVEGVPEPVTFWMSAAQFGLWRHPPHRRCGSRSRRGLLPESTRRDAVPDPLPPADRPTSAQGDLRPLTKAIAASQIDGTGHDTGRISCKILTKARWGLVTRQP
jgi:uncharacterized protein (DUF779 family)